MKKIIHYLKNNPLIIIISSSILLLIISIYLWGIKIALLIIVIISIIAGIWYGGIIIMKKRKKVNKKIAKTKKGKTQKRKTTKKNKWKKVLNILGIVILSGGILILIGAIVFLLMVIKAAPPFDPENLYRKEATIIYDNNGELITKIGREIRDKITYDELPEVLIDAIIATEDARFFQHNGFDAPRFIKAGLGEISGNYAGGASTISMQVVKNNFTSTERSYIRKFTDIYLAIFKLEKKYTKEQILEFYVNTPYLGNSSYGIAEATRNYFGKEVSEINLAEAAMLAGLFQAPGAYDPYLYLENTTRRRDTVLYLMRRHGYITKEQEEIAKAIPIETLLIDRIEKDVSPYQGYIDVVIREAKEKTGYYPTDVPMKIYTNLNREKQDFVNEVLNGEHYKFPDEHIQMGVAVTDIHTGAILAIGNGRNLKGELLYNHATMIKRQIGSTAKPIFDYGPGIEYNNWSTHKQFVDDVHSYSNGNGMHNWDNRYQGLIPLRQALADSRNIPALKAFQQVDNKKIIEFVQSLGITPEIESDFIHEAHAIGAFNGASPLQLAAAYAAFGNGGYYIEPYTINKIEYIDAPDKVQTYTPTKERAMSEATAFMITDVLRQGVNDGLVSAGRVSGVQVAAKSGTTNLDSDTKKNKGLPNSAISDVLFAGYSPEHAIGMWIGYKELDSEYYLTTNNGWPLRNRSFNTLAKGIFEKTGNKFPVPKSVTKVVVERGTEPAMLPSEWTPSNMRSTEYFKKGTEPTEVSPRYKTLPNPTNVDINNNNGQIVLTWDPITKPNYITNELLKVFGKQQDKYVNWMNQQDLEILGTIGYEVYLKEPTQLKFIGWTDKTSFTHKPNQGGTLTYIIKSCYSIYKNNRSTGHEITISDNPYIDIQIILKGANPKTLYIGEDTEYKEEGFTVIEDIINDVTTDIDGHTITTKTEGGINIPNNEIDLTKPETYIITYTITYKNQTYTATRKVIVTERQT
jgi:penicillin-binding protein 1A